MRPFLTLHAILVPVLCSGLLAGPLSALADGDALPAGTVLPTPTAWRLTTETLTLPGQEKMGLVGGNLLFDVSQRLRLGVGSYGAVMGERGGFITLGVAGEVRERLSPAWMAHAGLYVGAGGGRNASTLVGGGLMLRGDLGLSYETRYGNLGLGLSHVRFPSGEISSTQPYLLYEYPFYSLLGSAGGTGLAPASDAGAMPLAARPQEFSLLVRQYQIPSSVVRENGEPEHSSMQLMGIEWQSYLDERWFAKLEAAGAMGGQSAGYMQILAGGGYRLPLTRSTAIKFHAAAGPAGGGSTDTGGGLLVDAGLSLQQQISPHTSIELSLGEVRVLSHSFQAHSLTLKLSHHFGLPAVTSPAPVSWRALDGFDPLHLRVRVAQQTYFGRSPDWRTRSADQAVGNLGVQLDHFLTPHWFLTGQGLAAYDGNAGAYMTGQVGMGTQWPVFGRWFVEGEALLGAAGGGGLAVGGGLVGQVNANLGYRLSPALSLIATAGYIRAANGDFQANVTGLSLAYQFTGFAQK